MPLEIRPLTADDAPVFVQIMAVALGATGIGRLLHAHPPHPAYTAKQIASLRASLCSRPTLHYVKVVDTDAGDEIVAGAKWELIEHGRTDQELAELVEPHDIVDQEREEFGVVQSDFFGYLGRVRQGMGKTPHWFLHLLVTHPKHHRRGAGGMLVRWGTYQADKAGMISYLEATETGRPLYRRQGFEDVKTTEFDLAKYGGEGVALNTTMIRQPVKT